MGLKRWSSLYVSLYIFPNKHQVTIHWQAFHPSNILIVTTVNTMLPCSPQDRVLFRCKRKHAIQCVHYDVAFGVKDSDHKPVFGIYEVTLRPGRDKWVDVMIFGLVFGMCFDVGGWCWLCYSHVLILQLFKPGLVQLIRQKCGVDIDWQHCFVEQVSIN